MSSCKSYLNDSPTTGNRHRAPRAKEEEQFVTPRHWPTSVLQTQRVFGGCSFGGIRSTCSSRLLLSCRSWPWSARARTTTLLARTCMTSCARSIFWPRSWIDGKRLVCTDGDDATARSERARATLLRGDVFRAACTVHKGNAGKERARSLRPDVVKKLMHAAIILGYMGRMRTFRLH